jgi:hypothetical protein
VVQRGTHDELVRRPGLYRQMWELDEPAVSAGSCALERDSATSSAPVAAGRLVGQRSP